MRTYYVLALIFPPWKQGRKEMAEAHAARGY